MQNMTRFIKMEKKNSIKEFKSAYLFVTRYLYQMRSSMQHLY